MRATADGTARGEGSKKEMGKYKLNSVCITRLHLCLIHLQTMHTREYSRLDTLFTSVLDGGHLHAQQALPVWKERGTKWEDIGWIPGLFWTLSGTPLPRSFNLHSSHYTDWSISVLKSEQVETLSMRHLCISHWTP